MMPYQTIAYAQPVLPAKCPRATEYDLFARITAQLSLAGSDRGDRKALLMALFRNERLWSTLAADVAEEENALPAQLRARLFFLYRFTLEHSRKIRAGTAEPAVLIEINKAVMKGLRGQGADL